MDFLHGCLHLKSVIHDWNDERAEAILKSCRAAMAGDATLLVVELVPPPQVTPDAMGMVE